ncbi:hypothetical protein [Prevotella sp.]|uniref:hypothetical protein n=1 Tax=Prevotella sp. TaxID=59823 RepID=UPI0030797973
MKKPYLKPQISVIMIEPQAILASSGEPSTPAKGGFTYDNEITSGDEEEGIWE